MTKRYTTFCLLDDAMGTREMIRVGGGTVISTKPARVIDADGKTVPGFAVGYDLPVHEPSS
jgi:hypothetical protein